MKFNWKFPGNQMSDALKKACIEFEYELRPKITKFLIERLDSESCEDLGCFYFDVDLDTKHIGIGAKTPAAYATLIQRDFDAEFNGTLNSSAYAS
ncbi:hypothetical protein ABV409_12755 [Flagellimonas sp. DF-77]|uniref:hypothetical protein n=1 Tax=Flagellimonas algarum TaxID=3230298 RepID=UPI00339253CA